jgi:hypothetical protein
VQQCWALRRSFHAARKFVNRKSGKMKIVSRTFAGVAVAGAISLLAPAPGLAESKTLPAAIAHCGQTADTTTYDFYGGVRGMPKDNRDWKISEYSGKFDAADKDNPSAIPTMGKNNFEIRISYNSYTAATPDDIEYGVLYTRDPAPSWWVIPYGQEVYAEFTAAFDRREAPDKICVGAALRFTVPKPPEAACIDILICDET